LIACEYIEYSILTASNLKNVVSVLCTLLLQCSMIPIYGVATQRGPAARTNPTPRTTIMAQIARNNAEKATDDVAELGKQIAHNVADMPEVGRALVEFVKRQARDNVETFQALTRTTDWNEAARIQGEFLRASLERAGQFTRRYVEVVQAVMTSAASTTREQARKAA